MSQVIAAARILPPLGACRAGVRCRLPEHASAGFHLFTCACSVARSIAREDAVLPRAADRLSLFADARLSLPADLFRPDPAAFARTVPSDRLALFHARSILRGGRRRRGRAGHRHAERRRLAVQRALSGRLRRGAEPCPRAARHRHWAAPAGSISALSIFFRSAELGTHARQGLGPLLPGRSTDRRLGRARRHQRQGSVAPHHPVGARRRMRLRAPMPACGAPSAAPFAYEMISVLPWDAHASSSPTAFARDACSSPATPRIRTRRPAGSA